MPAPELVVLCCTRNTFRPHRTQPVRRWGQPDWPEYAHALENAFEWGEPPLPKEHWRRAYRDGCSYFAILKNGKALAVAGLWPRTPHEWEVTGVATAVHARRRGHARTVVSAVTAEILRAGRTATLTTQADNLPMIRAARAIGFQVRQTVPPPQELHPTTTP